MKITERDKVLLVLLGVILVVALAVVLPGVGVMACRESLATYKTDTAELESDLDTKRTELRDMGVTKNPEYASKAADELEQKIYDMMVEASHLAGNVMAYAMPYAVDEDWVDGLEYRYGIRSDEDSKIVEYSPISNVDAGDGHPDVEFSIDGTIYTLPSAERQITYMVAPTAECEYTVEMTMEGYSAADLGAVILFLHNIASKGSMLITEAHIANEKTVSFTLLMPKAPQDGESGIAHYAQKVAEKQQEEAEEGEEE